MFVGPPHGYCEKLLGASIFVGYFIVLFYVTIYYRICDWRLDSYVLVWLLSLVYMFMYHKVLSTIYIYIYIYTYTYLLAYDLHG
jgi:hypothetical protein